MRLKSLYNEGRELYSKGLLSNQTTFKTILQRGKAYMERRKSLMEVNEKFICPICGFDGLHGRLYINGAGQYDICSSCGFEYGNDDNDKDKTFDMWRHEWIFERNFKYVHEPKPAKWDKTALVQQIENIRMTHYIVDIEYGLHSQEEDKDDKKFIEDAYWMIVYTLKEYINYLSEKNELKYKYKKANKTINTKESDLCSVCGWIGEQPFYKHGIATGAQCDACGFQSGVTDNEGHNDFNIWRKKWVDTKKFAWYNAKTEPKNWSVAMAIKQLENLQFVHNIAIPNIQTRSEQEKFTQKVYTLDEYKHLLLERL